MSPRLPILNFLVALIVLGLLGGVIWQVARAPVGGSQATAGSSAQHDGAAPAPVAVVPDAGANPILNPNPPPNAVGGNMPLAANLAPARRAAIFVKAGALDNLTDSSGVAWEAESGFDAGDSASRDPALAIENTNTPELYRSEHYGMTTFTRQVPNGSYTVKLYFCETFEGITDAGQRVFGVKCGDQEIDNIDVFKETGGRCRPLIKTLNVNVTDGNLVVQFIKTDQNNPEINAIEIDPN